MEEINYLSNGKMYDGVELDSSDEVIINYTRKLLKIMENKLGQEVMNVGTGEIIPIYQISSLLEGLLIEGGIIIKND